jgi:hypothetical protein
MVSRSSVVSMGAPAAMRPSSGTSQVVSTSTSSGWTLRPKEPSARWREMSPRRSSASMCLAMVAFEETPKWRAICA